MPTFTLILTGSSIIPHTAERAILKIAATNTGPNKQAVSDAVLTTAQHIEGLVHSLQNEATPPPHSQDPAQAPDSSPSKPIAHWSKTSLTATSHVPAAHMQGFMLAQSVPGAAMQQQAPPQRQYSSRIDFDVRFRDFAALGDFSARLSALDHCEVERIDWILLPATRRAFESRLRADAAADALRKARDYCAVLCGSADAAYRIVPVQLGQEHANTPSPSPYGRAGANNMMMQQQQQMHPLAGQAGDSGLSFTPQEVRMELSVEVKFQVECVLAVATKAAVQP